MKTTISFFFLLLTIALLSSCEENSIFPETKFDCAFPFADSSAAHPKADIYQQILEENQKKGLVGAVLLVKDDHGLWMGGAGMADIASNVKMKSCNTFLIASISKVFTAAAVYHYVDEGLITLDDSISKWLPATVVSKVENAQTAQIRHLLAHTSGIADYYTAQLEFDRLNKVHNGWTKEQVLEYVYGQKATNGVGETYYYSNTNFLLLSMILESVSGLSFEQVYQQTVFDPLHLSTAYYSESDPIPASCVKGYADIYGNGQYAETEFMYKDELGIGGDGGVAINAYDLAQFLEKLMKGALISQTSLNQMTDWFAIPEGWHWDRYGQNENGYGIERFNTSYGSAVGHTGLVDGFTSRAFYFPEEDKTYILFMNSVGNNAASGLIAEQVFPVMFE